MSRRVKLVAHCMHARCALLCRLPAPIRCPPHRCAAGQPDAVRAAAAAGGAIPVPARRGAALQGECAGASRAGQSSLLRMLRSPRQPRSAAPSKRSATGEWLLRCGGCAGRRRLGDCAAGGARAAVAPAAALAPAARRAQHASRRQLLLVLRGGCLWRGGLRGSLAVPLPATTVAAQRSRGSTGREASTGSSSRGGGSPGLSVRRRGGWG